MVPRAIVLEVFSVAQASLASESTRASDIHCTLAFARPPEATSGFVQYRGIVILRVFARDLFGAK